MLRAELVGLYGPTWSVSYGPGWIPPKQPTHDFDPSLATFFNREGIRRFQMTSSVLNA